MLRLNPASDFEFVDVADFIPWFRFSYDFIVCSYDDLFLLLLSQQCEMGIYTREGRVVGFNLKCSEKIILLNVLIAGNITNKTKILIR